MHIPLFRQFFICRKTQDEMVQAVAAVQTFCSAGNRFALSGGSENRNRSIPTAAVPVCEKQHGNRGNSNVQPEFEHFLRNVIYNIQMLEMGIF
jgi:hypothetical protein